MTWVQTSARSGANRLWTCDDSGSRAVTAEGVALSSSLYGYGGTTWCVLDDDHVVTLHEREGVLRVIARDGNETFCWPLPSGSVGCPVAIGHEVLFIRDGNEPGERQLCRMHLDSGHTDVLYRTRDFMSRVARSADRLAWVQWSPRSVPWEESTLMTAHLSEGVTIEKTLSASGVSWGPPVVHRGSFAATRESGEWGELVLDIDEPQVGRPVLPGGSALSLVSWFGTSRLIASDGVHVAVVSAKDSRRHVSHVRDDVVDEVVGAMTSIEDVALVGSRVVVAGRRPQHSDRIEVHDTTWQVIATDEEERDDSLTAQWRVSESSVPYVWWESDDPATIIVEMHGGPTGEAGLRWSASTSRWHSRGYAVASIDYRGSTSYGRRYRRALYGGWAQRDADDVVSVIAELATRYPTSRIVVAGNSAGGLTALRVAARTPVWGAMVHYPVTDAATIIQMSHEFEAGYNEMLFGTTEARQLQDRRVDVERLPRLLVTHGVNDSVVPIAGTRAFVSEARAAHVDVRYLELENEGHGYRAAQSVARVADAERQFLLDQ